MIGSRPRKLIGELGLHRPERGLGVGFRALRRDLHGIAAACEDAPACTPDSDPALATATGAAATRVWCGRGSAAAARPELPGTIDNGAL